MFETLEGFLIDQRFELGRRVGRGGMGEVYRARDRRTGQVVALKILTGQSDRLIDRFARETELLSRLRHPAIVAYLGDGLAAPRRPYLAMEWLDGEELASLLRRGRLAPADAFAVLRRVADALAFVHARGVVHRDIKPSNLFVVRGEVASLKLIDLGIALAGVQSETAPVTGSVVLGTPGYMAPEQVRCHVDIGPPADLFALGCVVYECLIGRRAFAGDHAAAVQARVLLDELPPIAAICPDVPPGLAALLARMLSKDPAQRPADGGALCAELDVLAGEDLADDPGLLVGEIPLDDDTQAVTWSLSDETATQAA